MGKAEAMASSQVRRGRIVSDLVGSKKPLSGAALAKELGVSRQIIVQDIAFCAQMDTILWQPIVAMFWHLRGSRRYL